MRGQQRFDAAPEKKKGTLCLTQINSHVKAKNFSQRGANHAENPAIDL